jgi:hypothetical protein
MNLSFTLQNRGSGLRRRGRRRGAVAIEALIVSSLFIGILAGGLFMHRAYATKLRVIREARLAAWQPALRGCAKPPAPSDMSGAAVSSGDESAQGGEVSEETFANWVGVDEGSSEPRSAVVEGGGAFGAPSVSSRESVPCNTVTSDEEGVEALFDVLIKLIDKQ